MIVQGEITGYDVDTGVMEIRARYDNVMDMARKQYRACEIRLNDGRTISTDQRRKARAIVADICNWAGYDVRHEADNVHAILKAYFCADWNYDDFSLGNTDMTTAREYINYLVDFCLRNDVPCLDRLLNRTDDVDAYLYACLYHRKCAVCGRRADVHHVDAVGMGGDRRRIVHEGRRCVALCREHHRQAHSDADFMNAQHIYGIRLDRILCQKLGLLDGEELASETGLMEEKHVK